MQRNALTWTSAGVAGLTTAYLLSQRSRYLLTVTAKHMPGDYDIEYTSPWGGANFMPTSISNTPAADWDKTTWEFLEDLARNHPEAGVHFQGM
jgi:D-amino-acid oxidase